MTGSEDPRWRRYRLPPQVGDWGIAFAWPGCEQTALLGRGRFATREEALRASAKSAESWARNGYLVVQFHDAWCIAKPESPDRIVGKLVVRSTVA